MWNLFSFSPCSSFLLVYFFISLQLPVFLQIYVYSCKCCLHITLRIIFLRNAYLFSFQYLGKLYWRLLFPLLFCFIFLVRLYTTLMQQHVLSHIHLPKLMMPFALSRAALSFGDALTQYMLHVRATDRATYQTHSEFRQHNPVVPAISS